MGKWLTLSMIFSFLLAPLFAVELNFIKNKDGKIVLLDVQGEKEVKQLCKDYSALKPALRLETLIVTDFAPTDSFPVMIKILGEQSGTLRHLYFVSSGENQLKQEDLLQVVQTLRDGRVEDFRWEYQKKITKQQVVEQLQASEIFWRQLRYLSLKGTDLGERAFFLNNIIWENLNGLDLSYTNIDYNALLGMRRNGDHYPRLTSLDLDGTRVVPGNFFAPLEETFPRLKQLSVYSDFEVKDWVNLDTTLFQPLEEFYAFINYSGNKGVERDGAFNFKEGRILENSNLENEVSYLSYLQNLKFRGVFFRDYRANPDEGVPEFLQKQVGELGWFFASANDFLDFQKNYPNVQPTELTFAGPASGGFLYNLLANAAGKYASVRHIYLVRPQMSSFEIESFRQHPPIPGARVHLIDIASTVEERKLRWLGQRPYSPPMPPTPIIPKIERPKLPPPNFNN